MSKKVVYCLLTAAIWSAPSFIQSFAQEREPSEQNVVYGMYSGLALLMDVYKPAEGNGAGIVLINGSGWHSDTELSAEPLKMGYPYMDRIRDALVDAGYTVFSINHRAAPRFKYPNAVDDTKRAIQFARYQAKRFGIDENKLGALGHSSGAHLAAMVGVLDESLEAIDGDPISEQRSKVASVAAIAAPLDLTILNSGASMAASTPSLVTFLGKRPEYENGFISREGLYYEASPVSHVSRDDASFLLIQGMSDPVVPPENALVMHAALTEAGVKVQLEEVEGDHGPDFDPQLIVDWFNKTLEEQ